MDNSVLEAQQKRIDQLFRVYGGLRDELTALQRCLVDKGVVREMELLVHLHKHRFAAARQASPVPLGVDAKQLFDNLNLISSTLSNGDLASTRDLRATSQSIQKAVNNASPKLYAIGGVAVTGALNSAERYDPWRNQWETLPTMNFRRAMHTSAVIAGHLCICGGGAPGSPIGRTMMHFKPGSAKWAASPQMTTHRVALASAVVRGHWYSCGGWEDTYFGAPRGDEVILRSAERFDPAGSEGKGAWQALPDMITPRSFHSAVNLEGRLLVCGGRNRQGTLSSVECFDVINKEWAQMTFPAESNTVVVETVGRILRKSREVFEGYTSPLGIGFIVFGGGGYKPGHGACAPATPGPGSGPGGEVCPTSPGRRLSAAGLRDLRGGLDHYWVDPCSNYGSSNYSIHGLGCDRTSISGTGYAAQYAPVVRDIFNDVSTCPRKNLLWFHNLAWDHKIADKDGKIVTLFELINRTHLEAVDEAKQMASDWESLHGLLDAERFDGVKARFAQQVNDAAAMCNHIMGQYTRWGGWAKPTTFYI
eukprot:gnl/TRDRNA2_/TRDRNA2_173963_c0_seq6.p1 gnl/TRDRNA2_/TRDRNA2_173963_c0~~gnl/TRDRNA2_/TRDRNA2_173963_c0_seq6.p1  ORF type:complete len:534 (+),score=62.60 gnl/TRDRNA2_/TRDRNA2_173963_c0_seq6:52-1653(+)